MPIDRVRTISPERYRRLTLAALGALCAIVVTGAAVRLTGSGLGCSDWPVCERDQPVPALDFHAWIEFGNRLITGVVSVAVALAVLGSLRRSPRRSDLTRLSLGLVAGVLAQIVVGAFTVIWELPAAVVMVHFLLSMVLVWNATVLHHRAGEFRLGAAGDALPVEPSGRVRNIDGIDRRLVDAAFAWVWVVAVTGTVVTSSGPHRGDPDAEPLGLDIPSVTRVHSVSVLVFLAIVLTLLVRLRTRGRRHALATPVSVVLGVAVAQGAIGYTQYFTGVPVLLVAIHVAGATALFVATTWLWVSRDRPAMAPSRAPDRTMTRIAP